jgi:hypothetical protein
VVQVDHGDEKRGRVRRLLLVGVPRSGTSWAARALRRTEGIGYIPEPDNESREPFALVAKHGLGRFPVLRETDTAPDLESLWTAAFEGKVRRRTPRALAGRGLLMKTSPADVRRAFDYREPQMSARVRMVRMLASRPKRRLEGDIVMVKSVFSALYMDWIALKWKPEVLVITRHPYNVISSWVQLGFDDHDLAFSSDVEESFIEPMGLPRLERNASQLAKTAWEVALLTCALDKAVADHPDWRVISHEELCIDPVAQFRELCKSLDLGWNADVQSFLEESNRPGTGYDTKRVAGEESASWRKRLSDDQVSEINGVLEGFPLAL